MKLAHCLVLAAAGAATSIALADDPTDPDLAKWNDTKVVLGMKSLKIGDYERVIANNCYAYAVNKQTDTYPQPGRRGLGILEWYKQYVEKIDDSINKVTGDRIPENKPANAPDLKEALTEYGKLIRSLMEKDGLVYAGGPEIKKPNDIPVAADEHIVAVVVGYIGSSNGVDYHLFRRNKVLGGYKWSHKPGEQDARTTADDGVAIKDIVEIMKGGAANAEGDTDPAKTSYQRFLGYFKVKNTVQIEGGEIDKGRGGWVSLNTLSGGDDGWCLTSQAEVATLVSGYLSDLSLAADPGWAYDPDDRGVTMYIAPGLLSGADCDQDDELTILDFICFQNLFVAGDAAADLTGDGVLDVLDFVAFRDMFLSGAVEPALWAGGSSVTVTARDGVIRIAAWNDGVESVDYYHDVFSLEEALRSEAVGRAVYHPLCGD